MNVNTGATYPSLDTAIRLGEKPEDIVEIIGTPKQVRQISDAVKAKAQRRAASKRARKSRKKNR